MHITTPVTGNQLREARDVVFLADLQEALRVKNIHSLTLHMETVVEGMNVNRYVIAKTAEGVEITSPDCDGNGQHGQYIHPRTGDPFSAAFFIENDWRAHCKAERAKADSGQ